VYGVGAGDAVNIVDANDAMHQRNVSLARVAYDGPIDSSPVSLNAKIAVPTMYVDVMLVNENVTIDDCAPSRGISTYDSVT
jgi:hypothetical protein